MSLIFKYHKAIDKNSFDVVNLFLINQFIAKLLSELASNLDKSKASINNTKLIENFLGIELVILDSIKAKKIFTPNNFMQYKAEDSYNKSEIETLVENNFRDKNALYISELFNHPNDNNKATIIMLEEKESPLEEFYKQYTIKVSANLTQLGYKLLVQ
ncbi:MAG: hypothetical protein K9G11_01190 [Rickettsiaceae bacterium]|nr:hypothetical protein [Rickettsiaceae bacterium]